MQKEIEKIFQCSNCSDELFDAFQNAISETDGNIDLFKILLANPILTIDELKMYSETLSKIFKEQSYEIYSWTGAVIEARTDILYSLEESVEYYIKAWQQDRSKSEPFLSMLSMYNYDIDLPYNSIILNVVEEGMNVVREKRSVYYALAKLYEKRGKVQISRKYMSLAERSQNQNPNSNNQL